MNRRTKSTVSKHFWRFGRLVFASAVIGVLGYLTYINVAQKPPETVDTTVSMPRQGAEGRDETPPVIDTLQSYRVAPDEPRLLTIDKLSLRARVLPMGRNDDKSMQAPLNIFDSGWYTASAKPGQTGAMVVNAHASGPTREGLFAYLDTLVEGDVVTVERGDGQRFTYTVTRTEVVPLEAIDMAKVMRPYGTSEGLNLITCSGQWLSGRQTYDHRVIVYAKRAP